MGTAAPARIGCPVQAGGALPFWQDLPKAPGSKGRHEPPEPQDGPGASAASPPEAGILTALMDSCPAWLRYTSRWGAHPSWGGPCTYYILLHSPLHCW